MKTIITSILCLLFSATAMAHTGLKTSSPSHNSTLEHSPKNLSLQFNAKVRLIKLSLKDAQNKAIDIDFTATKQAASTFELPLMPLNSGNYSAKWIAISGDGHKVKGTIQFTITNNPTPTS